MFDVKTIIDAVIDGLYTSASTLLGYMTAVEGFTMPSKTALMVAALTGAVGALNQLRALRQQPK
jgi:hypothetical protein